MINKRKFKNHNLLKVNKYRALRSPFETLIIRWSLVRAQVGPQKAFQVIERLFLWVLPNGLKFVITKCVVV
jgi:hypothetical protein